MADYKMPNTPAFTRRNCWRNAWMLQMKLRTSPSLMSHRHTCSFLQSFARASMHTYTHSKDADIIRHLQDNMSAQSLTREKWFQASITIDRLGLPRSDGYSRTRQGCVGVILKRGETLQKAAGTPSVPYKIIHTLIFHANVRHLCN